MGPRCRGSPGFSAIPMLFTVLPGRPAAPRTVVSRRVRAVPPFTCAIPRSSNTSSMTGVGRRSPALGRGERGVDALLFGLLSAGVQEYLRGVVGTCAPDRGPEQVESVPPGSAYSGSAPAEACRLAAAWRALLRMHELGGDGRCVACGGGRRWTTRAHAAGRARRGWFGWWPVRRSAQLCTVWQVAVGYFIRRLPGSRR